MLLAIDVGNTNVVLGVFRGEELVESWRLATDNKRSADEYGTILGSMYMLRSSRPFCSLLSICVSSSTDVILS